jgi:hypothetical protein
VEGLDQQVALSIFGESDISYHPERRAKSQPQPLVVRRHKRMNRGVARDLMRDGHRCEQQYKTEWQIVFPRLNRV